MKYLFCMFASLLLLLPTAAISDSFRLADDIVLEIALPSDRWEISKEPSPDLVDEMAEHMHHDLEAQGKEVPEEKVREVAMKRLGANELFVRSKSGAHMEIDISPLGAGEDAPSASGVRTSARYAGQSMEDEEGVSEASSTVSDFNVPGAAIAYRLDVDYVQHDKRMKFVGIIGFESPYWLYFYATDPLSDQRDAGEMKQIFESLKLVRENKD